MINLGFFPSRKLAFYMARLFVTRTFAVLVMLIQVLMTLDLLGQAGKNSRGAGQHRRRFVAVRPAALAPPRFAFPSFSALLGTLIAFVTLNQNSEVVAMKAAGLSAQPDSCPLIIASW